jgi:hypothetical protein
LSLFTNEAGQAGSRIDLKVMHFLGDKRSRMKTRFPAYLAVIVLVAAFISGCQVLSTSQSLETAGSPSFEAGCYKVEFLGMTASSEVTSTWHYRMQGHSCAQPLRSWMLGLPACASVVDASPTPWGMVSSDLQYKMSGIQWQPGADIQDTEFSVTLTGDVKEGVTRAGVNGQDLTLGDLNGPVCKTTASPGGSGFKTEFQRVNDRSQLGLRENNQPLYRSQEAKNQQQDVGRSYP